MCLPGRLITDKLDTLVVTAMADEQRMNKNGHLKRQGHLVKAALLENC